MEYEARKSGIDLLGNLPWGAHFCQFYQTPQDLLDILVPYIKAGLENNEFCMWITSDPLDEKSAESALRNAVPNLDQYIQNRQIEIIPYAKWYLNDSRFEIQRVLDGWIEKLQDGIDRGYDGLRLTGNTAWLECSGWSDFTEYEAAINAIIGNYRMIVLCTYWMEKCGAAETVDVINNHEFALVKRNDEWTVIESSESKQAKSALQKALDDLANVNEELHSSNDVLQETRSYLENLLNYANAPIIVWDPSSFRITRFNCAFEKLSGYPAEKVIGRELHILFPEDSREESLAKIARTLAGEYWESVEIPILRKDGSIRVALWNSANILADDGAIQATIAQGQDITERKRAEEELARTQADAERHAAELESFIASMADGVALIDADGNLAFINDAGKEMLGIEKLEPFSNWLRCYQRYSMDGVPLSIDKIAAYQALNAETVRDMRQKVRKNDGRELVLSVSAAPVRDSQGQIVGATSIFRDASERVEFERRAEELYLREHHIANMLQQALIPPDVSYVVPGYKVAVKYQPALKEAEVGGDFYDIFELDDGKVGILIGDVAGKGLTAAMRVAAARYAIRSYALIESSPGRVLTLANEALSRDELEAAGMLTAFFAVLDIQSHTLTYASGGHEPPVIRDAEGRIEELLATGRPLGILDGFVYSEANRVLRYGDTVVMVTDGITEARSRNKSFFGKEGMMAFLSENLHIPLDGVASGLLEAALSHADGSLQDDAAIVAFELER